MAESNRTRSRLAEFCAGEGITQTRFVHVCADRIGLAETTVKRLWRSGNGNLYTFRAVRRALSAELGRAVTLDDICEG